MHLDSYAGAFEDYRRMVHANALRLGIGMPVDQSFEDQPPPQYLPPAPPAPEEPQVSAGAPAGHCAGRSQR